MNLILDINSSKYFEITWEKLSSNPNEVLSNLISKKVNLFDKTQTDCLFNFTKYLNNDKSKIKKQIENIIEFGTPRYDIDYESVSKDYPPFEFYAMRFYINISHFGEKSGSHGPIFLIFNQNIFERIPDCGRYKPKKGKTYKEGLIAVIHETNSLIPRFK